MKLIDLIIDLFWVVGLLWAVLMVWLYTDLPMPIVAKDILYAITGIMDIWLYVNSILGTIRFIKRIKK